MKIRRTLWLWTFTLKAQANNETKTSLLNPQMLICYFVSEFENDYVESVATLFKGPFVVLQLYCLIMRDATMVQIIFRGVKVLPARINVLPPCSAHIYLMLYW